MLHHLNKSREAAAFGLAEIGRCYTAKNICVLGILFDEPNEFLNRLSVWLNDLIRDTAKEWQKMKKK